MEDILSRAKLLDQANFKNLPERHLHQIYTTQVIDFLDKAEYPREKADTKSHPVIFDLSSGEGKFSMFMGPALGYTESTTVAFDINSLFQERHRNWFKEHAIKGHDLITHRCDLKHQQPYGADFAVANHHWSFAKPRDHLSFIERTLDCAPIIFLFTHKRFIRAIENLLELKYGKKCSIATQQCYFETHRCEARRGEYGLPNSVAIGTFCWIKVPEL